MGPLIALLALLAIMDSKELANNVDKDITQQPPELHSASHAHLDTTPPAIPPHIVIFALLVRLAGEVLGLALDAILVITQAQLPNMCATGAH